MSRQKIVIEFKEWDTYFTFKLLKISGDFNISFVIFKYLPLSQHTLSYFRQGYCF